MEAIVIALPPESPPARLGERFMLREGLPLRVGPGRDARLRLGPHGAGDLFIGTEANSPFVRMTAPSLRASLCGHELFGSLQVPVREGDSLYVHPGLVLEFRDRPKGPAAPHREARRSSSPPTTTPPGPSTATSSRKRETPSRTGCATRPSPTTGRGAGSCWAWRSRCAVTSRTSPGAAGACSRASP